jgi:hypothetical protein
MRLEKELVTSFQSRRNHNKTIIPEPRFMRIVYGTPTNEALKSVV